MVAMFIVSLSLYMYVLSNCPATLASVLVVMVITVMGNNDSLLFTAMSRVVSAPSNMWASE